MGVNINLVAPGSTLTNNNLNDINIKILDKALPEVLKDKDKNIKYIKVLSQEDYNITDPRNDTLYFINDISDDAISITNILDVAISQPTIYKTEPNKLWMLTADTEMEQLSLWVGAVDSGLLKLKKIFDGYVDGRITFDGTYEYMDDYESSTFVTKEEPFTVAINYSGEMYAFPSLKYKTEGSETKGNKAIYIDGNFENPVTVCSIDKGYCPELFRGNDQGVVIAYVVHSGNTYTLKYKQYGYGDDNSTVKTWGPVVPVVSKDKSIFSVIIRRLNDYRLGLTYNYWEEVDGVNVSRTEFRYSDRVYAGIAFHPEVIELKQLPAMGPLMYGVTRNDNIKEIEEPFLKDVEFKSGEKQSQLIMQLFNKNTEDEDAKSITIELLNPNNPENKLDDSNVLSMIGLEVVNTYPYRQYATIYDPLYGKNNMAKAEIVGVNVDKNKIIVYLAGHNMPRTPFKIIPSTVWDSKINVRYVADDFNTKDLQEKNMSGWFALENLKSWEGGSTNIVGYGERGEFYQFDNIITKGLTFKVSTRETILSSIIFNINGWSYNTFVTASTAQPNVVNQSPQFTISFNNLSGSFNFNAVGGTNINV